MGRKDRGGARQAYAPHPNRHPPAGNGSARSDAQLVPPEREEKHHYRCGVCDHVADATRKRNAETGHWNWLVGNSFDPECPGGPDCLRATAEALGTTAAQLKEEPLVHLGPWLTGRTTSSDEAAAPPPSEGTVAGYHSALLSTPHALTYLRGRGLTDETIIRYQLGYDIRRNAITFPIRDEHGQPTNIKKRLLLPPPGEPQKCGLPRRPAALYPMQVFRDDPRAVVLGEGEPDALLLNQHGIPAVTSTAGTKGWDRYPQWPRYFVGRDVAVLYDAGPLSYEDAEARAAALQAAGARRAWPVDLTLAGFVTGEDVGDWFCTYGWSADELRTFIWESRQWYLEDRRAAA